MIAGFKGRGPGKPKSYFCIICQTKMVRKRFSYLCSARCRKIASRRRGRMNDRGDGRGLGASAGNS